MNEFETDQERPVGDCMVHDREELERRVREAHAKLVDPVLVLQALKVIEALTSDDLVMTDKDRLDEIYETAHAALNHCTNDHEDWKARIRADLSA